MPITYDWEGIDNTGQVALSNYVGSYIKTFRDNVKIDKAAILVDLKAL